MKITKSELRTMISEALREALDEQRSARLTESVWTCFFDDHEVGTVTAATEDEALEKMMDEYPEYNYSLYDGCYSVEPLKEAAISGGQAEGGFLDTAKRPGGSTSKLTHNVLDGKKTKTVKAKDLKPGMITNTGEVKKVTPTGWDMGGNHRMVEISYGRIGAQGSLAADNVPEDRDYEVLDESVTEGIFDKFKKKKPEAAQAEAPKDEEQKQEEPKKPGETITTYTYDEWMQALEYGHKYYAEDGPEAGRIKLWDKAMEIAACKNLCNDVVACMDAWMKQEGNKNFPHKSYAKHLEEDVDPESIFEGLFNF